MVVETIFTDLCYEKSSMRLKGTKLGDLVKEIELLIGRKIIVDRKDVCYKKSFFSKKQTIETYSLNFHIASNSYEQIGFQGSGYDLVGYTTRNSVRTFLLGMKKGFSKKEKQKVIDMMINKRKSHKIHYVIMGSGRETLCGIKRVSQPYNTHIKEKVDCPECLDLIKKLEIKKKPKLKRHYWETPSKTVCGISRSKVSNSTNNIKSVTCGNCLSYMKKRNLL